MAGHGGRPSVLGSLPSRGAVTHGLAEQPGAAPPRASPSPAGAGFWGWGLHPEAGHGFCYCPGSYKRKRNSGAFCHCNPDSETDEDEEEGDEQQQLLNTPRRRKLKSTSKYIYQTLFLNGENSDIKICALGEEWSLHKIYLCQVSILFFSLSSQGSRLKQLKFF